MQVNILTFLQCHLTENKQTRFNKTCLEGQLIYILAMEIIEGPGFSFLPN